MQGDTSSTTRRTFLSSSIIASSLNLTSLSQSNNYSSLQNGNDWSMWGANPRRTSYHPGQGPVDSIGMLWSSEIHPGDIARGVSVENGRIFYIEQGRCLRALDSDTGEEIWNFEFSFNLNESILASVPAVDSGSVYFGGEETVYSIESSSGEEEWQLDVGGGVIESSPVVMNNTVYIGSDNGLHAIDAESGEENWQFETGSRVATSPAISGETIYIGSDDTRLYAIDAGTGSQKWNVPTGAEVLSIAISSGSVYLINKNAEVWSINSMSGDIQWESELDEESGGSPLPVGLAIGNGHVYTGGWSQLFSLDAESGQTTWEYSESSKVYNPILVDGIVYFQTISEDGTEIQARNAYNGDEIWTHISERGDEIIGSPSISNETIYIPEGTEDGGRVLALTGEASTIEDTNTPIDTENTTAESNQLSSRTKDSSGIDINWNGVISQLGAIGAILVLALYTVFKNDRDD